MRSLRFFEYLYGLDPHQPNVEYAVQEESNQIEAHEIKVETNDTEIMKDFWRKFAIFQRWQSSRDNAQT